MEQIKNAPDTFADQLLKGHVDFIEAGDSRRPGQAGSLRAVATGDMAFPIAIAPADKDVKLEHMQKLTLEAGMTMLREHAQKLSGDMGPSARVFTVKLRKVFAM